MWDGDDFSLDSASYDSKYDPLIVETSFPLNRNA